MAYGRYWKNNRLLQHRFYSDTEVVSSYQSFTPLAMLADEHIGFVVNANSSITNGRDLLERLKKASPSEPCR